MLSRCTHVQWSRGVIGYFALSPLCLRLTWDFPLGLAEASEAISPPVCKEHIQTRGAVTVTDLLLFVSVSRCFEFESLQQQHIPSLPGAPKSRKNLIWQYNESAWAHTGAPSRLHRSERPYTLTHRVGLGRLQTAKQHAQKKIDFTFNCTST